MPKTNVVYCSRQSPFIIFFAYIFQNLKGILLDSIAYTKLDYVRLCESSQGFVIWLLISQMLSDFFL